MKQSHIKTIRSLISLIAILSFNLPTLASLTSPNRTICEDSRAKCSNPSLSPSCDADAIRLCTSNNNDSEPICLNSAIGRIGIARCGNVNSNEIPICTDGRASCTNGTFKCDDANDMKLCSSTSNNSEPLCLNTAQGRIRSGFCLGSSSSGNSNCTILKSYDFETTSNYTDLAFGTSNSLSSSAVKPDLGNPGGAVELKDNQISYSFPVNSYVWISNVFLDSTVTPTSSTDGIFSYDVLAKQTTGNLCLKLSSNVSHPEASIVVCQGRSGEFYTSTTTALSRYEPNKWYHIDIKWHGNNYDFFVNGSKLNSNPLSYPATGTPIRYFSLGTISNNLYDDSLGTYYVDNINIFSCASSTSSSSGTCPSGQISCNGVCKTGNCCTSAQCTNGYTCQENSCTCPTDWKILCNGTCVAGDCCTNSQCTGGQTCQNNNCTCPSGKILCNGTCVTGTCCFDYQCNGGQACQNNNCACPSGKILCNGTCVTGTCCTNAQCSGGKTCQNYNCACLSGQRLCSGACVTGDCCDTSQCPSGQACQNNFCKACPNGTILCNGACVTGSCCSNYQCYGGKTCQNYNCACPSGTSLCNGSCKAGTCCTETISEYNLSLNSGAQCITKGPDGNLWFTQSSGNKIGKISTAGIITEYSLPAGSSYPRGITAGPDGNLWFTEYSGNKVGKISTAGTITEYSLSTKNNYLNGITKGPDDNLWATASQISNDSTLGKIIRIKPSGNITEYSIPIIDTFSISTATFTTSAPGDITVGPNENLWFSENQSTYKYTYGEYSGGIGKSFVGSIGKIGKITPGGIIEVVYISPNNNSTTISSITTGPDGNIWFIESYLRPEETIITYRDKIFSYNLCKITTDGIVTKIPWGYSNKIIAGPDGNIWATVGYSRRDEYGTSSYKDEILKISLDGKNTQTYPLSSGSYPYGITVGIDGNIWFTELNGNKIGKVKVCPP